MRYATEHYPGCEFRVADIYNLDFEADSFDYVLATEIFEHLPEPDEALQCLSHNRQPGAHLVISVPYEPYFHWGNLLRGKHWSRGGRTPAHLHFWHRHEFKTFLDKHVDVVAEHYAATFPWMLFLARF